MYCRIGKINKSLSRRFKIKTVFGQDDPRCMEEVIERRLRHSIKNEKGGFGKIPDLIFVDRRNYANKGCSCSMQKVQCNNSNLWNGKK